MLTLEKTNYLKVLSYSLLFWVFKVLSTLVQVHVPLIFLSFVPLINQGLNVMYIFMLQSDKPEFDGESIASLIIWFLCVLYSSMRTASNSQASRLTMSDKVLLKDDSSKNALLYLQYFLQVAQIIRI